MPACSNECMQRVGDLEVFNILFAKVLGHPLIQRPDLIQQYLRTAANNEAGRESFEKPARVGNVERGGGEPRARADVVCWERAEKCAGNVGNADLAHIRRLVAPPAWLADVRTAPVGHGRGEHQRARWYKLWEGILHEVPRESEREVRASGLAGEDDILRGEA